MVTGITRADMAEHMLYTEQVGVTIRSQEVRLLTSWDNMPKLLAQIEVVNKTQGKTDGLFLILFSHFMFFQKHPTSLFP